MRGICGFRGGCCGASETRVWKMNAPVNATLLKLKNGEHDGVIGSEKKNTTAKTRRHKLYQELESQLKNDGWRHPREGQCRDFEVILG